MPLETKHNIFLSQKMQLKVLSDTIVILPRPQCDYTLYLDEMIYTHYACITFFILSFSHITQLDLVKIILL